MVWLYVPDMEGLNSDLNECLLNTELFVMSRGNSLRPNTLLKKWKKGGWINRLSGLTLKPSMASHGVEKWISSLEDSHANPIQLLENKWAKEIRETCGPILSESLGKCDQDSYSLRMFQMSLKCDLIPLSLTSTKSGLMLHGVLWGLPMLARPIKENAGFYLESEMIPTPTTQGNAQVAGQYDKRTGTTLAGYARMFPTPRAREDKELNGSMERHKKLGRERETLTRQISGEAGLSHGGRLNPQWVAWLMGLPIGWINLDYSEME
jgi:hypothetical protein